MYNLNYINGKVGSIQKENMSIPLCEGNSDYQEFLSWNREQAQPLDLNSTIAQPPVVLRYLDKEIDEIKARLERLGV